MTYLNSIATETLYYFNKLKEKINRDEHEVPGWDQHVVVCLLQLSWDQ